MLIRYDDTRYFYRYNIFTLANGKSPYIVNASNVMKIFISISYVNMLNMPFLASISNILPLTPFTLFFAEKSLTKFNYIETAL